MIASHRTTLAALLALALATTGCGDDEAITVGGSRGLGPASDDMSEPSGPVRTGGGGAAAAEPAAPVAEASDRPIVPLSYRDEDFVEGDSNRDPFRNYAASFIPTNTEIARPQIDVIMPETALEEMRLIAIVSGVASPSAMIEDGTGTGHTVHRGDFVGREDVVNAGGPEGLPITLNWRVDRIHAGEVILTREDPTAPNRVPLTRVMALHEDDVGG